MSNITLLIGGRSFTVACAEGEEGHVTSLGQMIDSKLLSMGDAAAQNESRMLLFASLLLADELHELRHGASGAVTGEDRADIVATIDADVVARFAAIAERLEKLARQLEDEAASA